MNLEIRRSCRFPCVHADLLLNNFQQRFVPQNKIDLGTYGTTASLIDLQMDFEIRRSCRFPCVHADLLLNNFQQRFVPQNKIDLGTYGTTASLIAI
jgi:hypothetical protein